MGGVLLVAERRDTESESVTTTAVPATETSVESAPSVTTTPGVTIGSVAPPISVTTDDTGEFEADVPDFTPIDPPRVPPTLTPVPPGAVANDRISDPLPDGLYLGFPESALDEDGKFISWHIGRTDGPTYPAFLDHVLFSSVVIDARSPDHSGYAVLGTSLLWQYIADGATTASVPESDDLVVVTGPYLLTVVDGAVVAIEGIRQP